MDPQLSGIRKIRNKHSGMVVDVLGSGMEDGRQAVQNPDAGTANQTFTFESLGDGHYKIVAQHSGKVLDVENWGTADGDRVHQWIYKEPPEADPGHNNNQRWRLESVDEGYYRIVNKHSGKVFDVEGRGTGSGLFIVQWADLDNDSQKWEFVAG
jgi:hypothetical protein